MSLESDDDVMCNRCKGRNIHSVDRSTV